MASGFADRAVAALTPLGPVRARAMFGGHGIYLDDTMFALTADDRLWLKVDGHNRERFLAAGGEAFTYRRDAGKIVAMSYVAVPDDVWADRNSLIDWAGQALAAAQRAKAKKGPRKAPN
jgi:DNA transformation protein